MTSKQVIVSFCSLLSLAALWSCCVTLDNIGQSLQLTVPERLPGEQAYPGGSQFEHCDDALDQDDDLFDMTRFSGQLGSPRLGQNLSMSSFGVFQSDISANATIYFTAVGDRGSAFWGNGTFCDFFRPMQRVDGLFWFNCPPVEGWSLLLFDMFLPKEWKVLVIYGVQDRWYVEANVRNGTANDSARLFCIHGPVRIRPPIARLLSWGSLCLPTSIRSWIGER